MKTEMAIEEHFNKAVEPLEPENLSAPILYTLNQGGKRIRPQLVRLASEMFGGDPAAAEYVETAFEMLHNFTLIHDDIMDEAPLRRNQPTVYQKWNSNIAILAGDALATLAIREILKVPTKPETIIRLADLLSKTCLEVCSGQQYDLDFETLEQVSLDDYLKMIRLKTSVLLAACLKAGALLAGADEPVQGLVYEAGIRIGLAFQLKDDLLDVYSDTDVFGKVHGGDIRENKKTYLYLLALQEASPEDAALLRSCFAQKEMDFQTKYDIVTGIYNKLKIKEKTEGEINRLVESALFYINSIGSAAKDLQPLKNLVNQLTYRTK